MLLSFPAVYQSVTAQFGSMDPVILEGSTLGHVALHEAFARCHDLLGANKLRYPQVKLRHKEHCKGFQTYVLRYDPPKIPDLLLASLSTCQMDPPHAPVLGRSLPNNKDSGHEFTMFDSGETRRLREFAFTGPICFGARQGSIMLRAYPSSTQACAGASGHGAQLIGRFQKNEAGLGQNIQVAVSLWGGSPFSVLEGKMRGKPHSWLGESGPCGKWMGGC